MRGAIYTPSIDGWFGDDEPDDPADPGVDPVYPTRPERNDWLPTDDATAQWRADANLLQSVGYGGGEGAFGGPTDPDWKATVLAFQSDNHVMPLDGIMGPITRNAARGVAANLGGAPDAPSPYTPDIPGAPFTPDPSLPLTPTSTGSSHTLLYVAGGLAALLLVGLALTGGKKK